MHKVILETKKNWSNWQLAGLLIFSFLTILLPLTLVYADTSNGPVTVNAQVTDSGGGGCRGAGCGGGGECTGGRILSGTSCVCPAGQTWNGTICQSTTTSSTPVIISSLTVNGTVGTAFSYQITATNNPTSFDATGLPAGLIVNTANGLISGNPTAAGSFSVNISARNSSGAGRATLGLTIRGSVGPVITSPLTANGTVRTAFSYQIIATNNPTSFGATGLPPGLAINTTNGLISGTPTVIGTSSITLRASNSTGTGTANLSLQIYDLSSTPPVCLPNSQSVHTSDLVSFTARAGNGIFSWYAPGGNPASGSGLSFRTTYSLIGSNSVTLTSGGINGTCTVVVTASLSQSSPPASGQTNIISTQSPSGIELHYDDVLVFGAHNSIPFSFAAGKITDLVGDELSFIIKADKLAPQKLVALDLVFDGNRRPFSFATSSREYTVNLLVPAVGTHPAQIEARWYESSAKVLPFTLESAGYGLVIADGTDSLLSGVSVTLYNVDAGEQIWPAHLYNQKNEQVTTAVGAYGFVVPNGHYKLVAKLAGYHDRSTPPFAVVNHIVNERLYLIARAPELSEVIVPQAPIAKQISSATKFIGNKTREYRQVAVQSIVDSVQIIDSIAHEPQVQAVAKRYVTPAAISVAVAAVAPSFWSILLPLLRYLFLQPLLIIGKRKRQGWGQVYDSFTKRPIDLAIVRLIDAKAGRVVQTRVTDAHGRYLFIVEPGEYTIHADKPGSTFPSSLLSQVKSDGRLLDIYHGETIVVTQEGAALTPNIPLDPSVVAGTPRRVVWQKRGRIIQQIISLTGIFTTVAAFYSAPGWYTGSFLTGHIFMYGLFLRYATPTKPKGWGVVYDASDKSPIGQVIARLFVKQYDKLVDMQVTDRKGRYAFLVGPNDYYVTFEKEGYQKYQSPEIDLRGRDVDNIFVKEDAALNRAD